MKRDLATVTSAIKSGKGPPLLLLFGDDFQVQEAAKTIVDLLVPPDQRGFNFERLDGRSVPWSQIEVSLMTPPLFPGKKLLWVENAPYFFSREQKGELGEQVLQLWNEGKKEDAAKLLIDLLVVEGWSQEQWERLEGSGAGPLAELLGIEDREAQEEAEALLNYCKSRGMDLNKRKGAQGHRLFEVLEEGMPAWDFLLLSAVQVDRRTRIYKRCEELGAVLFLGLERDRTGKLSRDQLAEFINQQLRQAKKTIEPQAREMILLRAGNELRTLRQEINKLLLLVGERGAIRAQDVEAIFTDRGQGWVFDLTRAIASRDVIAALSELARLMNEGEHPLKLLGTIASEVRRLLAARQLMESDLRGRWRRGMTYAQFQQSVLGQGTPLLTRNPYADYMCFQRADDFSVGELHSHMEGIYEADMRLKSSGNTPRLVMERMILSMCLGRHKEKTVPQRRRLL